MRNITNSYARVIADYQTPYSDPISARNGDKVTIEDSKKTVCPGWVWCINQSGKSGWVPVTYLDRQGDCGYLLCDYDAIELTILTGEILF